jgi:spore maturation protein CgeB
MDDVCKAGCNNVAFIPFAYDPQSHFRELAKTTEERDRFSSDIAFIGFADPDRPPLIHALEKIPGIRISLYGGNWENFPELNKYYRGLAYGRDYRLALSGSKIILGLVRHANRDGHSMRTFEIPACKTFMLAERTDEHLELFEENQEAVYFGSIPEMVEKAIYYKNHSIERDQIASAGNLRLAKDRNAYSDRLITIFKYI